MDRLAEYFRNSPSGSARAVIAYHRQRLEDPGIVLGLAQQNRDEPAAEALVSERESNLVLLVH